jgi:protein O-GlcNAc transferase
LSTFFETIFRLKTPQSLFSVSEPSHSDGRIRIIFVSAHNFASNSTTARMLCPLIAFMQRRSLQCDISVVGMSESDEPHSSCLPVTSWHVFSSLSDTDMAQRLNAMRPHVLVDTVGFTLKSRVEVFAHRPARVQVHWHGMPYTSGSALFYDTYFGDRVSTSVDFRSSWAESLLLLPLPYLMNSHKVVHPRIDRGVAAAARTRRHLFSGLVDPSRKSLLAASFNVPFKIQRDLFECWCRVINRTDTLHLWIAG